MHSKLQYYYYSPLFQTCILSKLNLEYVKHDFWTMVAKEEVYERKLKCVFDYDKHNTRSPKRQPQPLAFGEPTGGLRPMRNGSITSMDRLILDSNENTELKEKLDQAKEQIKQLIQQGSDLRAKNERLEQDIGKKCAVESEVSAEPQVDGKIAEPDKKRPRLEVQSRLIMAVACIAVMWLGVVMGKYIM